MIRCVELTVMTKRDMDNMESVCLITAEPRGKWFGINSAEQGERGSICVCKRVIEYSLITKSECTESCSTIVCVCVCMRSSCPIGSHSSPFVWLGFMNESA